MKVEFHKYEALGNDYLVIDSSYNHVLTSSVIARICNRNLGIGADGILVSHGNELTVKIFNSDGSEAKKSGNGLRIFSRYLMDSGLVKENEFSIFCSAGEHRVINHGDTITINMKSIRSIYSASKGRWVDYRPDEKMTPFTLDIHGRSFSCIAVDIGNPHCVVLNAEPNDELSFGSLIECHSMFEDRVNVQFLHSWSQRRIDISIWERGSGHTMASGSSSCAAFSVAKELKLCSDEADVHMEGGTLSMRWIDGEIYMTGTVSKIAEGVLFI